MPYHQYPHDSQSSASNSELHRVQSLWFDDGTIVFQAGLNLYRVYYGVLCAQSTVFGNMGLLWPTAETTRGQSGGQSTLIDGCTVVQLEDDSEDVTTFFDVLFNLQSSRTFQPPSTCSTPPFSFLCRVLKMSTKYKVEHLRRQALGALEPWFPVTLDKFDYMQEKVGALTNGKGFLSLDEVFHCFSIVRQCGVQWMMPVAYYLCSSKDFSPVLELSLSKEIKEEDKRLLLEGQHLFMNRRVLQPLRERCRREEFPRCSFAKLELLQLCQDAPALSLYADALSRYPAYPTVVRQICDTCFMNVTERVRQLRQEVWDGLTTMLGIPSWPELGEARAADLAFMNGNDDSHSGAFPAPTDSHTAEISMDQRQMIPSAQRVSHLWFEDGNIIFRAGNSAYRLYQGALCSVSSIFRDLFSLPQPLDDDPSSTSDGCPVVQLQDNSQDLDPFFDVIFHPSSSKFFLCLQPFNPPFGLLARILRLSTKYDVPVIRNRIIMGLDNWFPTSIQQYDQMSEDMQQEGGTTRLRQEEVQQSFELARECSMPWILPYALYRCSLRCSLASAPRPCHECLSDSHRHGTNVSATDRVLALPQVHQTLCALFISHIRTFLEVKCQGKSDMLQRMECQEAKLNFLYNFSDPDVLAGLEDGVLSNTIPDMWQRLHMKQMPPLSYAKSCTDAQDSSRLATSAVPKGGHDLALDLEDIRNDDCRTCYYCFVTGGERLWSARMMVWEKMPEVMKDVMEGILGKGNWTWARLRTMQDNELRSGAEEEGETEKE